MKYDIKENSGKIVGFVYKYKHKIVIKNGNKPILEIDERISDKIYRERKSKSIDVGTVKELYDGLTMTISEIAAVYNISYYEMRKIIKSVNMESGKKSGRRNSSYGQEFSEQRLKRMSDSQKGHKPVGYIRTEEIRKKVSNSLKAKYKSGELVQDPSKKSKAWADGKYDYAPMGRGIQGYFHSNKSPKVSYFRSLFELFFMIKISEDDRVFKFISEPFKIPISDNSVYIPDLLINDKYLIELKTKDHRRLVDYRVNLKAFNRWKDEVIAACNFCDENDFIFIKIYDDRIGYNQKAFRKFISNNHDIINKYQIDFVKAP